jgi:hypothetical protein
MQYYKLDENRIPRPVSFEEYLEICSADKQEEFITGRKSQRRRVAFDSIEDYEVSTVFLDLNHRMWGPGDPIVFETMIFGPEDPPDQLQWRYTTYEAALQGHYKAVTYVERYLHAKREGLPTPPTPDIYQKEAEDNPESLSIADLEANWYLEQKPTTEGELEQGGSGQPEDPNIPDGPYPQG